MEPVFLSEIVEGERITLKRRDVNRTKELFALIQKNKDHLKAGFLPWVDQINMYEDTLENHHKKATQWAEKECFSYNIIDKTTDKLIGDIASVKLSWSDSSVEIGYWLSKDFTGRGLMSEAVKIFENHLFENGFNRIVISASSKNIPSIKIAEKNNYTLEGILRQAKIVFNQYHDMHIFSKLRHKWESEQKT